MTVTRFQTLLLVASLLTLPVSGADKFPKACGLVEGLVKNSSCRLTDCRAPGFTKVRLAADKTDIEAQGDLVLLDHECDAKASIPAVVPQQIQAMQAQGFVVQGTAKIDPKSASVLLKKESHFIELTALVLDGVANISVRSVWPQGDGPATAEAAAAAPAPPKETGSVILRLSGSNTIGAKLAASLAEAFLKTEGAQNVRVRNTGEESYRVEGDGKIIEINAHGSATAFTDLATDKCDIGMSSRRIKPDEAGKLTALGNMTGPTSEHVVGLDGLAIIVNRNNSLSSISKEDVAKIFRGEITDWKQLLANGGAIKVYARDDKSGTFDTFKTLVLNGKPLVASAIRIEDSRELSEKIAADPDAIGFIGLPYILGAKALAVSDIGTRALVPTQLTVATEDYALSRRLYLYTASSPKNPMVGRFVNFALAKAGQDIVGDTGFVAQTVKAQSVAVEAEAPSDYRLLTRDAERLSLDFRFHSSSTGLDNKALVDLDRVISFISSLHYSGKDVLLLGFADATGSKELNVKLSHDRAQAVAEQFEQRGLAAVTVRGFGPELPIASNATEDGREKNRRVEIWIKKHAQTSQRQLN